MSKPSQRPAQPPPPNPAPAKGGHFRGGVPNHRPPPLQPHKPASRAAVWDVLWGVRRSQRYHARRRAFYTRWHQWTAFAGIMGGSAVIASLGDIVPQWVALCAALMVAALCAVDLIAKTADMAHVHNDLRCQFVELERRIGSRPDATENELAQWQAARLAIEAQEPPVHVALDILCENELIRATGGHLAQAPLHRIHWFPRLTAHWLMWENV